MSKRNNRRPKRNVSNGEVNSNRSLHNSCNDTSNNKWNMWKRKYNLYITILMEPMYRVFCYIVNFVRKYLYGCVLFIVFSVLLTQQIQLYAVNNILVDQSMTLRTSIENFDAFRDLTNKRHIIQENKLMYFKTRLLDVEIKAKKNLQKLETKFKHFAENLRTFESGSNAAYAKQQNVNRRIQNKILENENHIVILKNNYSELDDSTKESFQKLEFIDTKRVQMMKRISQEMEILNQDAIRIDIDAGHLQQKMDSLSAEFDLVQKNINDNDKHRHDDRREYRVERRNIVPAIDDIIKDVVIKAASYVVSGVINTISSGLAAIGSFLGGYLW